MYHIVISYAGYIITYCSGCRIYLDHVGAIAYMLLRTWKCYHTLQ